MYEAFYGFREKPFHVTADPAFLYLSRQHQEAMDHLSYGLQQRLGFLMITGEVGTGKTTVARALVDKLAGIIHTALILNPALSGTQLLQAIAKDFGILPDPKTRRLPTNRGELIGLIENFLLKQAAAGSYCVLIIDEAQALSLQALEQVRLLSTVETTKAKLLQIILVGQPELIERLERNYRLRALKDRIAVKYHMQPLTEEETGAYINHRLRVASAERQIPRFTEGAISKIASLSNGIPRRINRICDNALLAGFVHEAFTIDEKLVEEGHMNRVHDTDTVPYFTNT
ncbi:MAG: AAA family ATPase [Candidatus Omnitrophica bacterium]|nr:AAA family ATPase [Candidatus Omnitrophota bacterium]